MLPLGGLINGNLLILIAAPYLTFKLDNSFLFNEIVSHPEMFAKNNYRYYFQNQAKLAFDELRCAPGIRPIMPQGAMYMMVEIKLSLFPEFKNELQFVERMVSEQSVFCLPGQVSYDIFIYIANINLSFLIASRICMC